jgi:hypothetical protein
MNAKKLSVLFDKKAKEFTDSNSAKTAELEVYREPTHSDAAQRSKS